MSVIIREHSFFSLTPRFTTLFALLSFSLPCIGTAYTGRDVMPLQAFTQTQKVTQMLNQPPEVASDGDVVTVTAPLPSSLTMMIAPKLPCQTIPVSDGADYLKTIPGFSLIRNGGTNGDPVFRGMFGSRLRLLVDGGEMLGACSSRMDSSSAYIFPESFDIITLVKGPQTVLWGPGSSAGTLRFERQPTSFYEESIKLHGSALTGSSGRLDQNIDTIFGNQFGYLRLMGNTSHSADYKDGGGQRVHSAWHKWNKDMAVGLTPTTDTLLEMTFGQGDGNASYAGRAMDGTRFARESFGLRLEQSAIGNVLENIELQSWYHYADHVMDNHARRSAKWMSSNVDRLTWGSRGIGSWQWKDVQLQGGTDIQVNQHRKKIEGHWQKDAHFQDTGLFAELSWKLKSANKFISGVRMEHSLANCNTVQKSGRRSEKYPALFLRYEHYANPLPLMTYVGLGISERFPDYWELITLKSGRGSERDAFHRLKREKTTQMDIGSHLKLKQLNGWVSAYAGHVKNFILFRYDVPHVNSSCAENVDAITLGGEMGIGYCFSDHWQMKSNLAWSFGENLNIRRPLPQIPPLEGRLALLWKSDAWSATGLWRLVAAQHRVAMNEGNVVGKDFGHSSGFSVLSTNLAWQATESLKCTAGIDNFFNRSYSEHLNLAGNKEFSDFAGIPLIEPGRTLWAKVSITF
ncbi:MAG: hypothetical protein CMIDDMOC_00403 [Sodalis sp. Fle]|nr:MAG: hypothetical protein CMIDDMOC_00403 [Sodalis sp. Fle]